MSIDKIVDDIIKAEGGFVDHKNDLGGATKYGITEVVARANGYYGEMRDLPESFARQVYKNRYWFEPRFDRIEILSPAVAAELTDTGVNAGLGFAKPLIQEALNLLNRQETDYTDVKVDGVIGNQTLTALAAYLAKRGKDGEDVLVKLLNVMQGARYIEITKTRPANENFILGWLSHRVKI